MTATDVEHSALADTDLLDEARNHSLVAFRQAWKRLDETVPGSLRLVPQTELRTLIEEDYSTKRDMIIGDAPDFGWIIEDHNFPTLDGRLWGIS